MFKTVTPEEAKQLLDDGYVYVDVRSEEEFADGHPTGARNVPVALMDPAFGMRPNADFASVVEANFPKDAKLVLGCKSGGRSARACEILSSQGYADVVNMDGGFSGRMDPSGRVAQAGWEQTGYSVSTVAEDGADYASLASKRS